MPPDTGASRADFRGFLADWVRPRIVGGRLPLDREVYVAAGRAGFYRSSYSADVGGHGDRRQTVAMLAELGNACLPGFSFWVHGEIFCHILLAHGSPAARHRYWAACLGGDLIGCIGLTEVSGGSSLTKLRTTAKATPAGYVVSGRKAFISLGGLADLMIVSARLGDDGGPSLFLVDMRSPGVSVDSVPNAFAMRELDMAHVSLVDVVVPPQNLLARNSVIPLIRSLTLERYICAVVAQGMLRCVVLDGVEYLKKHQVAGATLMTYQAVRFEASRHVAQMRAVESLVATATARYVAGKRIAPEAAAACKLQTVNALKEATGFVVSMHGARGVMGKDSKLNVLNDAFAQSIYGGTSEVMLEIIGNGL
jgi:acyl-CoA dehydrogenase